MANEDLPFNIYLLQPNESNLRGVGQVDSLDYFDTSTGEFHESGLFSIQVFGQVGDDRRSLNFGYIDIKAEIFHPVIYKALITLKQFYADVIEGKRFAVWSDEDKDFKLAGEGTGETGFYFFLKHWKKIEFKRNKSDKRNNRIDLIEKYKDKATASRVVVIPAGLRDLEVGSDGRPVSDEINDFYRKLIAISNSVPASSIRNNPELIDAVRFRLQVTFNNLYSFIENMIKGKKKLFLGKFTSRRVQFGTRNVITAFVPNNPILGEPGAININNTVIGLYQMMVAVNPVTKYMIRNGPLASVFVAPELPARLINKKTWQMEEKNVPSDVYDLWMSREGLDKILESFGNESVRHNPVEIEGCYAALIYRGPDMTWKILHDIRELPEGRSKKDVYPISLVELLYLSVYQRINTFPLLITRYPVAGDGSIYPSLAYVKTTVEGERRRPLDEQWQVNQDPYAVCLEYPIPGGYFFDSVTPHTSHLKAMGGDYDGDMVSANAVFSENAIAEITKFLKSRQAHIGTNGKFRFSCMTPTIEFVLANLSGD